MEAVSMAGETTMTIRDELGMRYEQATEML